MEGSPSVEPEHNLQRVVDGAELGLREGPYTAAQARSVERSDLFREDECPAPGDFDLGTEYGRKRARRRRRDNDCGQLVQEVRLYDDGIAPTTLLVAARAWRSNQRVDVTPPHSALP